jgi:hypothetical protein
MTAWGWVRRTLLVVMLCAGLATPGCSGSHPTAARTGLLDTTHPRSAPSAPSPSSSSESPSPPPPVPSDSGSPNPSQPPVVWIGGTLVEVARDSITVRETFGSVVTLQRLGRGATTFYEVVGGGWAEVSDVGSVQAGQLACVETLLNGPTLLALRVFLGSSCGPA